MYCNIHISSKDFKMLTEEVEKGDKVHKFLIRRSSTQLLLSNFQTELTCINDVILTLKEQTGCHFKIKS